MTNYLKMGMIVALVMTLVSVPMRNVTAADDDYMFKVHNTTKDTISKLLASEDGRGINGQAINVDGGTVLF